MTPLVPTPHGTTPGGCVFAGGGTGGHLYPAIAVARALRQRDAAEPILFVGSDRPQEREIVAAAEFEHHDLPLLARSDWRRRPVAAARSFWRALQDAQRLLAAFQPRVVIGCGGWASVPTVWAAHRAGTPVVLLEQNVIPGRATRWLSRWGDVVCVSFTETRDRLPRRANVVVTGNPVRDEIASLSARPVASDALPPLLLILGGSLGSQTLNRGVLEGVAADPAFWRSWRIVHQTGGSGVATAESTYARLGLDATVSPFLINVPELLGQATLVVSRAGATTLSELACAGSPTVVVPWRGAADDHQFANARWYADRGAMRLGDESRGFWSEVVALAGDASARQDLSSQLRSVAQPAACRAVTEVITATARAPRAQ